MFWYSLSQRGRYLIHAIPLMFDLVETFLLMTVQLFQQLNVASVACLQWKEEGLGGTISGNDRMHVCKWQTHLKFVIFFVQLIPFTSQRLDVHVVFVIVLLFCFTFFFLFHFTRCCCLSAPPSTLRCCLYATAVLRLGGSALRLRGWARVDAGCEE